MFYAVTPLYTTYINFLKARVAERLMKNDLRIVLDGYEYCQFLLIHHDLTRCLSVAHWTFFDMRFRTCSD